jgi:hypothetical protein
MENQDAPPSNSDESNEAEKTDVKSVEKTKFALFSKNVTAEEIFAKLGITRKDSDGPEGHSARDGE